MTHKLIMTIEQRDKLRSAAGQLERLAYDPREGTSEWRDVVGRVLDEVAEYAPSFERRRLLSDVTSDDRRIAEQFLWALSDMGLPLSASRAPPEKVEALASAIRDIRRVCGLGDKRDGG